MAKRMTEEAGLLRRHKVVLVDTVRKARDTLGLKEAEAEAFHRQIDELKEQLEEAQEGG